MKPFCLLLLLIGITAARSETASAPVPAREVVIVFKTHFDIGYTDMASNIVRRYQTTMIDSALNVVDRNRNLPPAQQFAWTLPGWPVSKILEDWPGQSPERKARLLQAFQEKRFLVHALPFSMHTELLELEDLVRGFDYSSKVSRSLGLELPRDAKMTDVPCHSWIMPTLLIHAGVDFLHLGCNAASSSPQVPPLFWWESPDGSRLLTMYTAEGYGTGLVPPANWNHKTWLALIQTGDNHGPPTPEEVSALLKEAVEKLPGVKVRIGRLSDFADAIRAEKPELPVVRGDMPDTWIHGPMADPAGSQLARQFRLRISQAESLHTLLKLWGIPVEDVTAKINKAREQSLLYGEHTWGGAQYWVTQYGSGTKWGYGDSWKNDRAKGRFQHLEDSWAEHSAYIQNASNIVEPILEADLRTLAKSVSVEGPRVVIYNPLPSLDRGGIVSVKGIPQNVHHLKRLSDNELIPVAHENGIAQFSIKEVPPMGVSTLIPAEGASENTTLKTDTNASTLENRWWTLRVDSTRGVITSLVDKKSGREWADPGAPQGLGQYLYQRFDADQVKAYVKDYVKIDADWAVNELGKPAMPPASQIPAINASPSRFTLRLEQNAVSASAILSAPASGAISNGIVTRVTLYEEFPYIDIETTLQGKPADPWPEAGWLCLPFKIDSPKFRLGRLGSVVDPSTDIVPGCNFDIMAVNTGLTVTGEDGTGIGICAMDNPLISLGTPGCWRYSKVWSPRPSRVYVNLFNNQWTTNFRMWNEGSWTSRVRLWRVESPAKPEDLTVPSEEARSPLMATWEDGPAGTNVSNACGLYVSKKGVVVTAFGPNPNGSGLVLRLWDESGITGPCHVLLPAHLEAQAKPVDLRGQPVDMKFEASGNRLEWKMNAFSPATFELR